jgi:uncharacterized protein YebE (UPF0316 family)
VWDPFAVQWEEGFGYLQRFHQREGHCRLPREHQEDGYPLGQWAQRQRDDKDTMLLERRQRVEALDLVWDPFAVQWEEGFGYLQRFHQREGHYRVPSKHNEDGYPLGRWVSGQRRGKDTMLPERRQRLEALGFVWDVLTVQWEEGFGYLHCFHQREGHCCVPNKHNEDGYPLGRWVGTQRVTKGTMLPERRQRLEALGFVWDPFAVQWEEGFGYLQSFHQREGHCRVPKRHREQNYQLGEWVAKQRQDKDDMSPDRRKRLDALGFVWKVR